MAGATIVAYYGSKPTPLATWLMGLQARVAQELRNFRPRPIDEIHATVIGLEYPLRSVTATDIMSLSEYVVAAFDDGVQVKFGDYLPGGSPFASRGQDPYVRSFALAEGRVVLIGWPVRPLGDVYYLAEVRRGAERFGFRHRYHGASDDLDPDCYMAIGDYGQEDVSCTSDSLASVEAVIRQYLVRNPVRVGLSARDLSLVRYRSTTLERAGSVQLRLPGELSLGVAAQISEELTAGEG
jgi:hypothetical protein